jgi:hypothetical protein
MTEKHDITELVKKVEIQEFESGKKDLNIRFKEEAEVDNNLITYPERLIPEWNPRRKQELQDLMEKGEELNE